ncbi:C6 zinc finger domain protein [Penicillium sp. IBT 18751x]|nr:C6 zinc finger domain protein [Penicillium sp. IBT 18751x]
MSLALMSTLKQVLSITRYTISDRRRHAHITPDSIKTIKNLHELCLGKDSPRARKVKCDETVPHCLRCTSTGRRCDGYREPPPVSRSWEELLSLQPRPSLIPEADAGELHSLEYFRDNVGHLISGSLEGSLWTRIVARVLFHEPAVRHAVVAVSNIYEHFAQIRWLSLGRGPETLIIRHYNKAIKHVLAPASGHPDTVLLVCLLFVCIEFLRGDAEAAITHVRHGINLVNSSNPSPELIIMFRHLGTFPFFFGNTIIDFPIVNHVAPKAVGSPFKSLGHARGSLEWLMSRTVALIRAAGAYRLSGDATVQIPAAFVMEQQFLNAELADWREGLLSLEPKYYGANESMRVILEMRWLICKIWVNTCLARDEIIYDNHHSEFRCLVELGKRAVSSRGACKTKIARFMFEMAHSPLLHFVVIKCRYLGLRLEALSLVKELSCPRQIPWDAGVSYALGRRIVEVEHGIELPLENAVTLKEVHEDSNLPSEGQRVLDAAVERQLGEHSCVNGIKVLHRKTCFLMRDLESGGVKAVQDWITIQKMSPL